MSDTTAPDVDRLALRELLKRSTQGDWYALGPPWIPSDYMPSILAGSPDPHAGVFVCDFDDIANGDDIRRAAHSDAELICALKNNAAALLNALDAAEAKVAAYGAVLDLIQERLPDVPLGELPGEVKELQAHAERYLHLTEHDCTDIYADYWDVRLRGVENFDAFGATLDSRIGLAKNAELEL